MNHANDHGDVYQVPRRLHDGALISADTYQELYRQSVENPDRFWTTQGKRIDWIQPWKKVSECDY